MRWGFGATAFAVAVLAYTGRFLDENRRTIGAPLLPTLGPGNALTLQRGLALAMMAGFLVAPHPPKALAWVPAALFTAAAIADFFDGYLARRANHSTKLGARLDIELDGVGVFLVAALAVSYGRLPIWFLPIGCARYLFVAGLWCRARFGLPVYDIPESAHRRFFAGAQMAFLSIAVWPGVPTEASTLAGFVVGVPVVIGFVRDWLVATGDLNPKHPTYLAAQHQVVRFARELAPPVLRVMVVVAMSMLMLSANEPAGSLSVTWRLMAMAASASIALGWLGRLGAVVLLLPLGSHFIEHGLQPTTGLALAAAVSVALLGTGAFSLSRREDKYLLAKLGSATRPGST